jgi:methionine-rich copper-binding protein CopC
MPRLIASLAAALALAVCGGALAHSKKETTVPADGARLDAPPAVIAMEFDAPMRITLVSLTEATGGEVELAPVTGPRPATRFEATPPPLGPGDYRVDWRGLAEDGHPMEGGFSFTVE